ASGAARCRPGLEADRVGQLLDHLARGVAESAAQEVRGARGRAEGERALEALPARPRGRKGAHHRVPAALAKALLEWGRGQPPGLLPVQYQRGPLTTGHDHAARAALA